VLAGDAYEPAGWFRGREGPEAVLRSPSLPGLRVPLAGVFRAHA
jgi:hypothetical protein